MKFTKKLIRKLGIKAGLNTIGQSQRKFWTNGGDEALRYNAELKSGDTVFDLGAYEGEFTAKMMKPGVHFHLFEINPDILEKLRQRFDSNDLVIVNPFGLGDANIKGKSSGGTGSGATFLEDVSGEYIIKDFVDYIRDNKISEIQLLKINIEGPEYDLIEHLDRSGTLKNVAEIQVQPHDFTDDCFDRLLTMHRIMSKTHDLASSYPFVWDFWVRR